MHPIRTPLKTELGLSASAPRMPRGIMAHAAKVAAPPRNDRRFTGFSIMLRVFMPVPSRSLRPRLRPPNGVSVWFSSHEDGRDFNRSVAPPKGPGLTMLLTCMTARISREDGRGARLSWGCLAIRDSPGFPARRPEDRWRISSSSMTQFNWKCRGPEDTRDIDIPSPERCHRLATSVSGSDESGLGQARA